MLPVEVFRREMGRHGPFWSLMTRYAQAFVALIMQSSACNGLHSVEQRCCRWLLMTHDRVGRDEFGLTQESLAVMLGVRRATVSGVASDLQEAGLLTYAHGKMTIANRRGLETAACECYRVVKSQFARLLPT
jgi:CRP-like cAMP-binding protein